MQDVFSGFEALRGKTFTNAIDVCNALEDMSRECVKVPQRFPDINGDYTQVNPEKMVTVWTDTHERLGDVGYNYQVVQYPVAFSIINPLIEKGARVIGGGLINRGERAVLVLETDSVLEITPGDTIVNRIVVMSSHDGTGKIEIKVTPYRRKTGVAIALPVNGLSFKHTLRVEANMVAGRKAYARIEAAWDSFSDAVKRMIAVKVDDKEARAFIEQVLPTENKRKGPSKRLENQREDVFQVYKNTGIGRRSVQCKNTLFGVFMAFVEWADHHKTIRTSKKRNEAACNFDAKFIGDGAKKKMLAYGVAKKLQSADML